MRIMTNTLWPGFTLWILASPLPLALKFSPSVSLSLILPTDMMIEVAWKTLIIGCCVLSHFSCIRLFATLWIIACQAPLSKGFSKQEYWSGLPFPSPGSPQSRDQTCVSYVSCIGRWVFTTSATYCTEHLKIWKNFSNH